MAGWRIYPPHRFSRWLFSRPSCYLQRSMGINKGLFARRLNLYLVGHPLHLATRIQAVCPSIQTRSLALLAALQRNGDLVPCAKTGGRLPMDSGIWLVSAAPNMANGAGPATRLRTEAEGEAEAGTSRGRSTATATTAATETTLIHAAARRAGKSSSGSVPVFQFAPRWKFRQSNPAKTIP